jgi:hypothetical protein
MKIIQNTHRIGVLCSFLLFIGSELWAQPAPPSDPTPLPGLALLAAAGCALGVKKVYDSSKKEP